MKNYIMGCVISVLLLIVIFYLLNSKGFINFNNPSVKTFPIKGIDVSNHQGLIDWQNIKKQGFIIFVFIKSTEGKDLKDKSFVLNWLNSKKFGFKRGAYHFFTFSSNGSKQADNFISVVPIEEGMLPPVVDVEFAGNSKIIPSKEELKKELMDFIYKIQNYYQQKPIIYVTNESYQKYIQGDFQGFKIWVRDIVGYPSLRDGRQWTFWQYNNKGRINGIVGYVDLNVFNGDGAEFEKLGIITN